MTDDDAGGRSAQAAAVKQALASQGRVPAQGAARRAMAPLWIGVILTAAAALTWMLLS